MENAVASLFLENILLKVFFSLSLSLQGPLSCQVEEWSLPKTWIDANM